MPSRRRPTPWTARASAPARARRAFTLIELLAVLLIMGLAMALVLPNIGARQTSALREEAVRVAQQLELARQLAVVTGNPHRLLIDVEVGAFRLEWFGDAQAQEDAEQPAAVDPAASQQVDYSPPKENLAYQPIDSRFGSDSFLAPEFFFEGLDTAEGWFDSGEIALVFERDGTTDAAELVIADDNGNSLVLQVLPLLDTVRILDDEG